MKLRHQILLLLAIPLICEVITMAFLSWSFAGVEEAVQKEVRAKQIIALTQEINGVIGQRILITSGTRLGSDTISPVRDMMSNRIVELTVELRELVRDDQKSLVILDRLEANARRLDDNLEDLVKGYVPGTGKLFFSQFFDTRDYFDSMKLLIRDMHRDQAALTAIYQPVVEEFQPKTVAARSNQAKALMAGLLVNVLIVAFMAVLVGRHALARLQILMQNMRAFSGGKPIVKHLEGRDELAELDAAFKEMTEERLKLEELRKSLIGIVSHDLRSPLTAMLATIEVMREKDNDEKTRRQLTRLHAETQRLVHLSKVWLDSEKIESGHVNVTLAPVDAGDCVSAAVAAIKSLADARKIDLVVVDEKPVQVLGDKNQITQILVNFIANSVKFAPSSSAITVRYAVQDLRVKFEVIDAAEHISPNTVTSLFEKFEQMEQSSEIRSLGTGLGLWICKMLAQLQNGSVGYTPIPEGGNCFWLDLPEVTAEESTSSQVEAIVEAPVVVSG